jgi:hypothetical protein
LVFIVWHYGYLDIELRDHFSGLGVNNDSIGFWTVFSNVCLDKPSLLLGVLAERMTKLKMHQRGLVHGLADDIFVVRLNKFINHRYFVLVSPFFVVWG